MRYVVGRLLLALLLVLVASPAWAALTFNGTSDCATSASNLTAVGGATKVSVSVWSYWDAFANDDKFLMEYGAGAVNKFTVDPDGSNYAVQEDESGTGNVNGGNFTRPSAAAWHHYVFTFDRTAGAVLRVTAYLDGSAQTLGGTSTQDMGGTTFATNVLYLMSRSCSSLFGAGRLAEVAVYTGIILDATDASALYNSGNGAAATTVQSGSLSYYWKLCTDGTATTGGINMTLTGTTGATHPISTCAAVTPLRRVIRWQ